MSINHSHVSDVRRKFGNGKQNLKITHFSGRRENTRQSYKESKTLCVKKIQMSKISKFDKNCCKQFKA